MSSVQGSSLTRLMGTTESSVLRSQQAYEEKVLGHAGASSSTKFLAPHLLVNLIKFMSCCWDLRILMKHVNNSHWLLCYTL